LIKLLLIHLVSPNSLSVIFIPTMISSLIHHKPVSNVSSLKKIMFGGAPCPSGTI
jgi:hypothetical protein